MDTRDKILPLDQLPARLVGGPWLAVAGTFDPLTLGHAERMAGLASSGKSVLAVIQPSQGCLLTIEARAVLVAALKSVQLVVVAEPETLPHLPQLELIKDDAGERQRSADFVAHVRGRQTAP